MTVVQLQQASHLGDVSITTIKKALHEKGLGSYREQWKFILDEVNRKRRMEWCEEKKDWTVKEDWIKIGFTDEMSIEVGSTYGVNLV